MPRRKSPLVIILDSTEQAALEHLVRSPTTPNGVAQRARIILHLAAGVSITRTARQVGLQWHIMWAWGHRFLQPRLSGLQDLPRAGRPPVFPPEVAVHLVKLTCERPDILSRSLSQWNCIELARHLEHNGIVAYISPETVRRIRVHHKLKPWRHHLWLSPHTPHDMEFYARVSGVVTLYTRRLHKQEIVLCVDEKTSLQPRPRVHATCPARPGRPTQVEHAYKRAGALNLFAGFDTRTGRVYGQCYEHKRQHEFIAFLKCLDAELPAKITTIHLICDNARSHHGQQLGEWLKSHPRFVLHFTPVHCSWLNQVEQ
jgi:hypothetical protein